MSAKEIGIGLFGFGTIGAGVVKLLKDNSDLIAEKTGYRPVLKNIVDIDTTTDRGVDPAPAVVSANKDDILDNDGISIVIELIGGAGIAKEIVSAALEKGKHVATANKELIAKCGPELRALGAKHGAKLLFEASVGGGIPVITPLLSCLRANRIDRVLGIVNGTTNYILTQMESTGAGFDGILKEAQSLGYAEADPTNDVEGFDAAYKAIILAAVAFGKRIEVGSFPREGITGVTRRDMGYAGELGYTIKLLAVLENAEGGVDARVHPTLLPREHPLASIHGVLNAVYLEGEPIGPLMFVGRGAGPAATSSAVVGDVISLAAGAGCAPGEGWDFFKDAAVVSTDTVKNSFYIRMRVKDQPGVLADIGRSLGDNSISISSVIQKDRVNGDAELVCLTHEVEEGAFRKAMEAVKALDCVGDVSAVFRVFS